jgi:predicted permease
MDLLPAFAPIFLLFALGIALRRLAFMDQLQAAFFLRLVFFVTLPALILVKVSTLELTWLDLRQPLLAVLLVVGLWPAALLLTAGLPLGDRRSRGSAVLCCIIANNAFMIPFVLWGLGDTAFAYLMLFDVGLALVVSSFAYALAFHYASNAASPRAIALRVLQAPPLWAVLFAVLLSVSGAPLPSWTRTFLETLGDMTSPLLLIALGVFFRPAPLPPLLVTGVIALRMVGGGLLGLGLTALLGLEGTARVAGVLCCSAPIGFNALTFSTLAELDTRLTAALVSYSLLVALLGVPLLVAWLPALLG